MAGTSANVRNIAVAGVLLALFLVVGIAFRFLIYPLFQDELVSATSSESRYDHELTLLADGFSGYAALRSAGFHKELNGRGIKIDVVDDAADYAGRIRALKSGRAELAVFTIDAFVAAGANLGDYPGSIVAVIDETYGADAIVAYKSAVPDLQTLNSSKARLVLTPSSPSEFLARVAIAEFGLNDLSTKWVEADGAEAVAKKLRKAKQSQPHGYVLWEPSRSVALENPDVHVLFDSSRLAGYIVDVLVVRRQFLVDHPDVAQAVVEAMLRAQYAASKTANGMVELVIQDAKATGQTLKPDQAQAIVDGIRWRNTLENYAHFGLVAETPGVLHLEDSIANISGVLVRTGGLPSDPLEGRASELFFRDLLEKMHGADFHPGQGLGIVDDGLGTADLEAAQSIGELPALNDAQWDQLTPVGSLQVKPIAFGRGNARLNVQSQRDLDGLARRLRSLPQYYLSVVGHARAEGDPAANLILAQERSHAASSYLVERGIDSDRVRAVAAKPTGTGGAVQAVSFTLAQQPY